MHRLLTQLQVLEMGIESALQIAVSWSPRCDCSTRHVRSWANPLSAAACSNVYTLWSSCAWPAAIILWISLTFGWNNSCVECHLINLPSLLKDIFFLQTSCISLPNVTCAYSHSVMPNPFATWMIWQFWAQLWMISLKEILPHYCSNVGITALCKTFFCFFLASNSCWKSLALLGL